MAFHADCVIPLVDVSANRHLRSLHFHADIVLFLKLMCSDPEKCTLERWSQLIIINQYVRTFSYKEFCWKECMAAQELIAIHWFVCRQSDTRMFVGLPLHPLLDASVTSLMFLSTA